MEQITVEVIEAPGVSVEVVQRGEVLAVEVDRPSQVRAVEVIHPGPQGPGSLPKERRVDASTPNVIYTGSAPNGALEAEAAWSIQKSQFTASGVKINSLRAEAVTWTNFSSHPYS
jgi:hypothetical protein